MRLKVFFTLSLFLVLFTLPTPPVRADSSDRLAKLSISVWPEYDDPSVLVIYDGEFANKDGYPRQATMLVPSDAKVNATAYGDENGQFFDTDPWKTEDAGGGWTRVLFTLPKPSFHLEFYYNPLQGTPAKKMEYLYSSAQAVDSVQLEIQQPLKATDFKTDPAAVLQTTRGHDFKYHIFQFSNVTAGQTLRVQVSYTKTDPNPSVASITIPSAASGGNTATDATPNSMIPVAVGAGGLALGALGFLAWRGRRANAQVAHARQSHNPKKQSAAEAFCHNCGNALRTLDAFCPKCGTRKKG